jgi:hypothetical protein
MHQYYIGLTENWKPGGQLHPKRKSSQETVYLGCSFFLKYFKMYVQYMLWVTWPFYGPSFFLFFAHIDVVLVILCILSYEKWRYFYKLKHFGCSYT